MENTDLGNNTTEVIKESLVTFNRGLDIWKSQLDAQNKNTKLEIESNVQLTESSLEYTSKYLHKSGLFKLIFVAISIVSLTVCACLRLDIPDSIITFISLIAGYFLRDTDLSLFATTKVNPKHNVADKVS